MLGFKYSYLLILITTVYIQYSKSSIITTAIWVEPGQPITIPCSVKQPKNNNNYLLEWRRDSQTIFNANGNETGHYIASLQGRCARAIDMGITFHAVTKDDSAVYQCVLTSLDKNGITSSIQYGRDKKLVIYLTPKIVYPSFDSSFFVPTGKTFNIKCQAEGEPHPHLFWTKDNQIFNLSSELNFEKFHVKDSANYACHAVNLQGTVRVSVNISNEVLPKMTKELKNITVIEGQGVHLECQAEAKPSNITYKWFKGDLLLSELDPGYYKIKIQGNNLYIAAATNSDAGWYSCQAENGSGHISKSASFVTVMYKPKVVQQRTKEVMISLNEKYDFVCQVDANPPIHSVQWAKDGKVINTTQGNTITVTAKTQTDGGVYSCQPFNLLGTGDVSEIVVTVAEPLVFFVKPPPNVLVNVHGNAEIACSGYGYPPPVQYWLRNKIRLATSKLTIFNATAADGGLYQCILANGNELIIQNVSLQVNDTLPQCPQYHQLECENNTGLKIGVKPGFSGGHEQEIQFKILDSNDQIVTKSGWMSEQDSNFTYSADPGIEFSIFKAWLEAKNSKGTTSCFLGSINVCSKLDDPIITYFDKNTVTWKPVQHANDYVVAVKIGKNDEFVELATTTDTFYNFYELPSISADGLQVAVKAISKNFPNSDYSIVQKVQESEKNLDKNLTPILLFALIVLSVAFVGYRYYHSKCAENDKKQKNCIINNQDSMMINNEYLTMLRETQQVDQNFYYDKNNDSDGSTTVEEHFDPYAGDDGQESVVNETLRNQYMCNPEFNKINVIDELRLAQLKHEMSKSFDYI